MSANQPAPEAIPRQQAYARRRRHVLEQAILRRMGPLQALDAWIYITVNDAPHPGALDSLAWVLFKKKNYAEAKKHLLEAVKGDEGRHVEIFDHLADVHIALGEKKEAVEVWKKALELENVSKRDEARKEEIKKKLAKEQGEK